MRQENIKLIVAYAVVLGIAYLALGVAELVLGIYNLIWHSENASLAGIVPADILGGFASLVIGATFLGSASLLRGVRESWGYIIAGLFLSAVYGVLYMLIVGADGLNTWLSYVAGEGDWTWDWLTSGAAGPGLLRPEIWLFLVSLPLAHQTLRALKQFNVVR
jgi:predicted membrane-bound dolichyl-phosphate-mannose-protein mannosyltransferase